MGRVGIIEGLKGSLTSWNDAKGFGFITPESGGERVFAHISAYQGRGRPLASRKVVYAQMKDKQGRLRAARFQYSGAARLGATVTPGVWIALLVAAAFWKCDFGVVFSGVCTVAFAGRLRG
ncbi:MAG: cold shock domain-containing protein [Marinobacter sp.]|nr:cold shock domain-containing protein [Marinobacter sp.]